MRTLHRDIGFLLIGMVVVYALSGILLIYRDTDFLKKETHITKKVAPNMNANELGQALHIKRLKADHTEGDIMYFKNGTYNTSSGEAQYTQKELPAVFNKLISLHKSNSGDAAHWFAMLFGFCLLFLAISSFWMFKKGTKRFKRGLYFALTGIACTILILMI